MSKKLSRRDFARTSVAAGAAAAAVALPKALFGETASVATSAPEKIAEAATTTAAARGASAARRRMVSLPPQGFAYGGDPASSVAEFRDSIVFANSIAAAGQQKLPTDGSWAEGLTIPSDNYIADKHYGPASSTLPSAPTTRPRGARARRPPRWSGTPAPPLDVRGAHWPGRRDPARRAHRPGAAPARSRWPAPPVRPRPAAARGRAAAAGPARRRSACRGRRGPR